MNDCNRKINIKKEWHKATKTFRNKKIKKSKKLVRTKLTFCIFKGTEKISRIRVRKKIQRYGSADPNLYQNVTDPEHCHSKD
jgi:hypothetical protein